MSFSRRELPPELESVRESQAPDALVLDAASGFQTLAPETAEELGLVVDSLSPATHSADSLPADAPDALKRYVGPAFTIGLPGDGSVTWTRQTDPPVVICKPRLGQAPTPFAEFLIAEALTEIGLELPERFVPFFGETYLELAAATDLAPEGTFGLAAALFDGWCGLHTRDVFADWQGEHSRLHDAWLDAGQRLEPRLDDLPGELARGETGFPAAAELACGAVKHAIEPPAPFGPLAATAYREHGTDYAVQWAETTFAELSD